MKINKINGYKKAAAALDRSQQNYFFTEDIQAKEESVRKIVFDVKERGDVAVREYIRTFDKVDLVETLEVPSDEIEAALDAIDMDLREALVKAADRIRRHHQHQLDGLKLAAKEMNGTQVLLPVERAAVYAPGGRGYYPSSVLMTAVIAKTAGVNEVILLTPPSDNGHVASATLAAAAIAGVDRVFAIGGAQGIAAAAFGTESMPKVDVIAGPGNIYVTLAKKLVYGAVNIDGLYGPSEAMVIADETASPVFVAAEILAQAEHDPLSQSVFITTSEAFFEKVQEEMQRQYEKAQRQEVMKQSLARSVFAVVESLDEAIELANLYAAEHLCLMFKDAENYIKDIKNAGCIFVGVNSGVEYGDYVVGPSHALPTGGSARFYSPLNLNHFMKITDIIALKDEEVISLAPLVETIAKAEGFSQHAYAANIKKEKLSSKK